MSEEHQPLDAAKTNNLFIWVSLFSFVAVVLLSQLINTNNHQRIPASINSKQLKQLHDKLSVHQKIKPPILVSIDKEAISKVYAGDEFEITAKIISEMDTNNAKVEWHLPEYLEVVSGELMHQFAELKAGEKKVIRLVLKSHSEENQQIHITASAPYGKQTLSAVDQFNTMVEEELKSAKADLVKRNLEYMEQNN